MRNILKSLFIVLGCLVAVEAIATNVVALAPNTYSLSSAPATSGSKKFNMNQNIYYGRNGGGLAGNNGVEVKSGSMVAFKIKDASTVKFKVRNSKTKSITDTWTVKAISDADFAGIIAQYDAGGNAATYYSNSSSELSTLTITHTGVTETYTNETSILQPGCYGFYLSGHTADGDFVTEIVISAVGPSKDATLSDLQVDGVTIAGFDPNTTSYNYTVPASTTTAPVLSATKHDTKASDPVITQPTMPTVGNPTTGTVQVTAEDETTTKTYTVTFTRAEVSHDATLSDIQVDGQSIGNFNPATLSYTVNIPYSQTTIPVVTATTTNAAAIANVTPAGSVTGTATIVVTAEDGTTKETYTVTFQKVTASTDATLKSLSYNNTPVSGFSPSTTSYSVTLPAGSYPPNVTAVANHPYATVDVQQIASTNGTVTVTVTAEDRQTTKTYTIEFSETACPTVPQTSLSIHMPKVYEKKIADGGYGGQLIVFDRCEYEVYYATYDANSNLSVSVTPIRKTDGITNNATSTACKASDGWFEMSTSESKSDFTMSGADEFQSGSTAVHKLRNNGKYTIHIQGYDQFSFYGKDNSGNGKYFEIHIDGVKQTMTKSTSATIRRFNISTCEHVIEVIGIGDSNEEFYGFSLRLPQVPKIEHLRGNDSTQVVLQTMPINKVVYTCKYKYVEGAATRLEWDGPAANGITLNAISGSLADTLTLSGIADCPVGTYKYILISTLNDVETSRVTGTFVVKSDIRSMTSINAEAYQNEEMDQIIFKYYALDANDVHLTWPGGKPQGVDGYGTQQPGEYVIGGIPTTIGNYRFAITVEGADTTINGKLTVKELNYGENPVLFLYKNDSAYTKNGVYNYLKNGTIYNPISRRAKLDGLRTADQYSKYKWILISEDVDADNPEILALARGEGNLPVLNMKAFAYTQNRLNWGDPNNGSLTKEEGRFITVVRDDHPIFKALNKKRGDRIQVLDSTGSKGLMPISVDYAGTLCLATARTRDINNYDGDGPEETFLHEIPANIHRNQKYLCLPIGQSGTNYLHAEGKRLIDECIKYILGNDATIQLPDLAIKQFQVGSYTFLPEMDEDKIIVEVMAQDSDMLKTATPVVSLASPLTHAYPTTTKKDGSIDLYHWTFGVQYIVSDYINKRSYDILVRLKTAEGIDEIEVGEWINIYDIYGRKVATTNEDYRTMDLPRGMYILVTESGKTLKIMR